MLETKLIESQDNKTKQNSSGGILKFINEFNSAKRTEGKKCNPHRQFGISADAPIQFCSKNTLICDMNRFKQFKNNSSSKPEFFSQKNFFTIGHGQNQYKRTDNNFVKQYNQANQKNKMAFHHKTSKISNFYDQNAWMGSRFFVMGHQRSENALQLSNNEVQFRTRSAKSLNFSKKKSMTPLSTFRSSKGYPTHQSMKNLILTQKSRIRQMRNSLANYHKAQYQEYQQRPKTSLISTSRTLKATDKKPRQFQINLPEWGQKQFDVRHIDWNPQRSKN